MTKRSRNIYNHHSQYKLSRSKIELFINCRRCFYIDRKLGINQLDGYPFTLNIAVDNLLKNEFDSYRILQEPHPLFLASKLNLLPFQHENLNIWRNSLHKGISYEMANTNFLVTGGLDDIWINVDTKELIVVDYKATSKQEPITLDADWQKSYKRQAEIYQWLLRKNNFNVSNIAYFVYANARKNEKKFDNKLIFDTYLISYEGNDNWVEKAILDAYKCLQSDIIPESDIQCKYCQYISAVNSVVDDYTASRNSPDNLLECAHIKNTLKNIFKKFLSNP